MGRNVDYIIVYTHNNNSKNEILLIKIMDFTTNTDSIIAFSIEFQL